MKYSKTLMAILVATSVLAACGQKEEDTVEQPEQHQEVEIEVAIEADKFKEFVSSQMDDFVTDTQLLASLVKEGKLEEAQKLYPLVTMYYERMQPIASNFEELDVAVNGVITKGKENEVTGFQRLAYGLFTEKQTSGYEEIASKLASDVKALQEALSSLDVTKNNVLVSASLMFDTMLKDRLTTSSIANNEVYAVKAQTEAAQEIVKIFMPRVEANSAANATEKLAILEEVIAYYEVGKEDYVNYSFFTTKQKEELSTAIKDAQTALEKMNDTLK
ncbi:MAG: EfeM/EfeO family lipoprotein [Solibacillus sp.]|uniref:EfeM/EfeO family lipoprotein n=1 Tax=unclassified Solibacillus TaxID=2637870 RepID=UPI0030F80CC9